MGLLFKALAIGSIIAFFLTAGWVIMSTVDGVAFRYFLLSALVFVGSVFGGFSWLVWREMARRENGAVIERIHNELTKKNLN